MYKFADTLTNGNALCLNEMKQMEILLLMMLTKHMKRLNKMYLLLPNGLTSGKWSLILV